MLEIWVVSYSYDVKSLQFNLVLRVPTTSTTILDSAFNIAVILQIANMDNR